MTWPGLPALQRAHELEIRRQPYLLEQAACGVFSEPPANCGAPFKLKVSKSKISGVPIASTSAPAQQAYNAYFDGLHHPCNTASDLLNTPADLILLMLHPHRLSHSTP